jgi:hypothetical protein
MKMRPHPPEARLDMRISMPFEKDGSSTWLRSGPAVFVLFQSHTIQKAQVSEFGIVCFSTGFGFEAVGELRILTSYQL